MTTTDALQSVESAVVDSIISGIIPDLSPERISCLIVNFFKKKAYDSDDDGPVPTGTLRDHLRKQKKKMEMKEDN